MDAALLKESFDRVVPQKEAFAEAFYNRLFTLYPETKALFANTDMKRQQSLLVATLAYVVNGVAKGDDIVPAVQQLGSRHGNYGVTADYYPKVGQAILETLKEFLGAEWTLQVEQTWISAYGVVSSVMQQAPEKLN